MSLSKKINARINDTLQTGFGTDSENSGGRFFKKDGTPNLHLTGINFFEKLSIYDTMLRVRTWKFILIIFCFYGIVNLFFAFAYIIIGIEHLGGIEGFTIMDKFWQAFFFSAQTITTVGYGHIYPIGTLANSLAAVESLMGLLLFALATGMMYGRFSKPKAYLRYSKNALFSPYKDGIALMFRMVPYKHNNLSDAEVKATLALKLFENGKKVNRFFPLTLEISTINALTLSWTIVHHITEESPLYNLSKDDLLNSAAEVLVFLKAYDDAYSSIVVSRTSFEATEFVYGAKFKLMYHPSNNKEHTVMQINMVSDHDKVPLPYIGYDLGA